VKPIIFLLGPSGSGKSTVAKWTSEDLRFLHIEIDRFPEGDGIDLEGLRNEWSAFYDSRQVSNLAAAVRDRVTKDGTEGAVLSFPSRLVLSVEHIEAGEQQGIRTVILYGTEAECLDAFLGRERKLSRGLDEDHWIKNNAFCYASFNRPQFSKYR